MTGRAALRLLVLLLVALLGGGLLPAPAYAGVADRSDPVTPPAAGAPWYGPGLDWDKQLPAVYSDRLGLTPSLYSQRVRYPLGDDDATYLEQFAQQAATQGAIAVVSLEPQEDLADLTEADAQELADELDRLHESYDSSFLVRFAPEMNGTWVSWEYVTAFRTVARAVHADAPDSAMVWSPAYGSGYPFGAAYGALDQSDRELQALDTDGDGRVDLDDDPYGPYFPGDAAVDWVGLSLYYFGEDPGTDETTGSGTDQGEGVDDNRVPGDGEYQARLDETWGYPDDTGRESFYERFAEPTKTPMLVETGALWAPALDGADELEVKQAWWRQVFAADADHPLIRGISWLELSRREAEAADRTVYWGAARTDRLAEALRPDLEDASLTLGPVTRVLDQEAANEATAQARVPDADTPGGDNSDEMGWIVFCAAALAVLFLLAGLAGRFLPSWRYPNEHDPRDKRLDLFRGFTILAVVFTHIELSGVYAYISLKAVGAITGAEMFVLLSGIVLGMIYLPMVRKLGEWATAVMMFRRARKQYVTTLVVVVLVWVIGKIPGVDATVITTFTDRGTGENGQAVTGQVYDLYSNFPRLLDYPPPTWAIRQFLLLEMGPWVFNIMGLFVVLSLLLPALMWVIKRRLWWLLLVVSWALYAWDLHSGPIRVLPSQFQDVFPLLTWQIVFTHGLVLGVYRTQVTRALTSRLGKICCAVFVLGYAGSLVWLWAGHHYGFSVSPYPGDLYDWLYTHAYVRVFLQPGRLVDCVLMLLVVYAVTTTMWRPLNAVIGWLWIPLGQASLYVFVVHVFFTLAVGNIPGLDRTAFWIGTLIHTVVVLLIWLMVRKQFLFKVIPR